MSEKLIIFTSNGRKAKALLHELLPALPPRTEVSTELGRDVARTQGCIVLSIFEDDPANIRVRGFAAEHGGICWCLDLYDRQPGEFSIVKAAETSPLCVFSSERNLAEYRLHAPCGQRLGFLPYPIAERPVVSGVGRAVACAGSPLCEDQMHIVLPALADTAPDLALLWMISPEEELAARALLRQHGMKAELFVGRTLRNWEQLLARSALAFHLHVSAYGDLGPELALSLMSGVPAIVSDYAEGALLSDAVAVKISPGEQAGQELRIVLERLLNSPEASMQRRSIGSDARVYAMECFPVGAVAAELRMLITSLRSSSNLIETELKQLRASV